VKTFTGIGIEFELGPNGELRRKTPTEPLVDSVRPSTRETATEKIASGKKFAMSAEERIYWEKTKALFESVKEGFNKLSDKQILSKMMDRAWVQSAIDRVKQQHRLYSDIVQRSRDRQAVAQAEKKRQLLEDHLQALQEHLSTPRPDNSSKLQGPKTRTAKKEMAFQFKKKEGNPYGKDIVEMNSGIPIPPELLKKVKDFVDEGILKRVGETAKGMTVYRAVGQGEDLTGPRAAGSWVTPDKDLATNVYAKGDASRVVADYIPEKDLYEAHPGGWIYAPEGTNVGDIKRTRTSTFNDMLKVKPGQRGALYIGELKKETPKIENSLETQEDIQIPRNPQAEQVVQKALAEGKDGHLWTYISQGPLISYPYCCFHELFWSLGPPM